MEGLANNYGSKPMFSHKWHPARNYMLFTQLDGGVKRKLPGVHTLENTLTGCNIRVLAALYANRHYLRLYREHYPERLSTGIEAEIIGDVFIDPTAIVHKTAKIGPNVTISAGAIIGAGVRIRESIILPECVLEDHCCVLYSVIGWRCVLGSWSRVEGTPVAPNPNVPFAKLDNKPLFNTDGRLNPSLTILGSDVHVIIIIHSIRPLFLIP